jgi:hypothetical protein
MCVDCVLASLRIAQVDPVDEPLPEVVSVTVVEQLVLINVHDMLQSMGKDIQSFPLPLIDSSNDAAASVPREIYDECIIEVNEDDKNLHKSLNTGKWMNTRLSYLRLIVQMVEYSLLMVPEAWGRHFFIGCSLE